VTSRSVVSLLTFAVVALVGLAAIGYRAESTGRDRVPPTSAPTATGASAQTLAALPVAGLETTKPYVRTTDFGPAWADDNDDSDGHNGCDTRNDILHRDLTGIITRPATHDCVVIAGTLADPYSGTTITFAKADASAVQIDHIVPLHDAWELGAWSWSQQQRVDYANDPLVLLAVSGPANESKGDRLADRWRPQNVGKWCDYAQRTVAVHTKYHLPVTAPERSALSSMLGRC
jgi:hypothetical protein